MYYQLKSFHLIKIISGQNICLLTTQLLLQKDYPSRDHLEGKETATETMVNVTQVNVGKRLAAWKFLADQLSNGPRVPLVILIQEQTADKLPYGNTYEIRTKDGPRPRAQIYVEKNLAEMSGCTLLTQFSDEDLVAVSMKLKLSAGGSINCILCSAYLEGPASDPIKSNSKLKALTDYCKAKHIEIVLGADVNGHSTDFGCSFTDKRGESFVDFCFRSRMAIANTGSEPTFMPSGPNGPQSIIDITAATEKLYGLISNWEVNTEYAHTDHRQIHFTLDSVDSSELLTRSRRLTNWNKFEIEILKIRKLEHLASELSCGDLDKASFELNDLLLEAFENSSKIVKKHVKSKQCWFTDKLEETRQKVDRLKTVASRSKTVKSRGLYVLARNNYNSLIKKAKRENFRKKVEKLACVKDYARLHKFFENGPAKRISTIEKEDGGFTRSLDETMEVLMKKHFPNCEIITEHENWNPAVPIRARTDKDLKEIFACTTITKIENAINSFSPFKAPGDDGIFPALLQKSKKIIAPILQKLFRASLTLGYIPIAWRGALVTFIPKAGKDCYRKPGAYRPISLTSFILKLLEKLIDKKIRFTDLKDEPLCDTQHAYQSGLSTTTALHSFTTKIEQGLHHRNGATLVCYLDFQGAFDNLPTKTVLDSARKKKLPAWTIEWIEQILTKREIKSSIPQCETSFKPTQGTPQGAVTSPVLFSIALDSLLELLKSKFFDCIAYADDVCIMITGHHGIDMLYDRMRRAIKTVEDWCATSGLKINADKTQLMLFTKMKNPKTGKYQITLNGKRIELVKEAKYLGIHFDSKLNMKKHITEVTNKANRALWAAKAYSGSTWGTWPHVIKYVYEGIILARIFYGALFYWHKTSRWIDGNGTNAALLNTIHRRACMMITGAFRSTPQAALSTILNLPPIDIGLTLRALKEFHGLKQSNKWKGRPEYNGHALIQNYAIKKDLNFTTDSIPISWHADHRFTIDISTSPKTQPEAILCFVDASTKEEKSAVGMCTSNPRLDFSRRLSDNTDINTAEVMAIKAAADELLRVGTINRKIVLFSDSQEALKRLDNETFDLKSTKNCITSLNKLSNLNTSLHLEWLPKKEGNFLHRRADRLASEARNNREPEIRVDLNPTNLEKAIARIRANEMQKLWDEASILKTKNTILGPQDERINNLPKLCKQDLKLLIAALTNHSTLNKDLHRMRKTNDPHCRFCNKDELEDMHHVLFECSAPEIIRQRRKLFELEFLSPSQVKKLSFCTILTLAKRIGIREALAWRPP